MEQDVYVKPERCSEVSEGTVRLGQVATVYCSDPQKKQDCETLVVLQVPPGELSREKKYVVSALRLIELVQEQWPGTRVYCLGEVDFVVVYRPKQKENHVWETGKALFVGTVLFVGAAFAIMTFNNDGDVPRVFSAVYSFLMGREPTGPTALELGYTLGVPLGILVFFDHFGRKHWEKDPTPVEVQMCLYEQDVEDTLIRNTSRKGREVDAS